MLYTIVPYNQVWDELDGSVSSNESQEVMVQGCVMQVTPIDSGSATVVRLLSTNPSDYLNPALQPGSVVLLR